MTEAAITWVPGSSVGNVKSGTLSQTTARTTTSPTISHFGTRRPDRPTQLIDWVRASCIAAKLTIATAPAHGKSIVGETGPHRFATIIIAAITLAAAKNGASWAREIS